MKANYFIIPASVFAVGYIGSMFTNIGLPWYNAQNIPSFAPPGGVIGIAWSIIYTLSIIAIILWWNGRRDENWRWVLGLLIANGFLNAFWCYLFFTSRLVFAAIIEMVILEATVIALIILLWRRARVSAILFVPYAVWVVFATYLAYSFWRLN